MSDTASRNPTWCGADAGGCAVANGGGERGDAFRVAGVGASTDQSQLGLAATGFAEVVVSPVVMRKLRPAWQEGGQSKWELLISATGLDAQVNALDLASAQSLFAMTLAVTVAGQDFLIESVAANEALGSVYLYRLLLRESGAEPV
jgi:hypothetical protein